MPRKTSTDSLRGPGLLKELKGFFSQTPALPLLCPLYELNEKPRHFARDCTNNFWGFANLFSSERPEAARASGKISGKRWFLQLGRQNFVELSGSSSRTAELKKPA